MSDEIREATILGIELIAFGLIVLIIACFGLFARQAFNAKSLEDATRNEINEFAHFYEFTNGNDLDLDYIRTTYNIKRNTSGTYNNITESFAKQNGNEVTGDDILRFIALYTYEYDIVVYTKSFNLALTKETQPEGWALTDLSDKFKDKISNTFYCFAVYDSYNYEYDAIVFYEKTT